MAQSAALLSTSVSGAEAGKKIRQTDAGRPVELSRERLLACLTGDQQGAELWARLHRLGAPRRRRLLRALADGPDSRSRKLLAAAVWDEDAEAALAAIAGLRSLADESSAAPLAWLKESSRVQRVAEAAQLAWAEIKALHAAANDAPAEPPSRAERRRHR
jgi:hypothetical protein